MNRERGMMIELNLIDGFGNFLRGHFAASNSVNEVELLIGENDIGGVELIPDCPPPILVFGFVDEL